MVNFKEMMKFKGLLSVISDDVGWWLTSFALALLQPVITYKDPLTIMGFTTNFIMYLVPTLLGCLVAVYKSKLPIKERWAILASSLLFNGYVLESIFHYMFGSPPNSFGYFMGGLSAYFIFNFLFTVLNQIQTKGVDIFWGALRNKANSGADAFSELTENKFPDEMGDFMERPPDEPEKPKRKKPSKTIKR
jgi:hypothetical protein